MPKPQWHFSRRRPSAGRARNPQVEKFFRSDVVEDQTNAIIREGIQNSLDAGISGDSIGAKSVNVQVSFGECSSASVADFIPGLFEHLDAIRDKLPDVPTCEGPLRYLAFEDFNTTGLKGNALEWDPPDNKNAFFNFFRGEGVTDKAGNQRGRHGVGKMVFSTASRVRSVFGVTATAESGPMLMGTSTLILHKRDGVSFDPDGWFGVTTRVDDDDLVGPVHDSNTIERFATTFGLDRETLPGLSIVVPWLHESVTPASALQSVIRGFFWPILQRQLYVDIKAANEPDTAVSAASLSQLVDQIAGLSTPLVGDLRATIDLAIWAISRPPDSIPPALAPTGNAQAWDSTLLTHELKQRLRDELLNGQPIALRVPMRVRLKGQSAGAAQTASFDVYLKPDASCPDGSVQFIREGLLIPGVKSRRFPGYRALVIVEEGPLASFLGDAENPSHTEWQEQNVRDKYVYPKETLRYVVQSVPNLLKTLYDEQKTADPTLLLDLFSLPAIQEAAPRKKQPKKTTKEGGKTDPPVVDPPPPRPRRFTLQKRDSGFVIRRGAPEAEPPRTIDVRIAYAARRGNPLKKYRKSDFRLNSQAIDVDVVAATVELCEENRLRVAIDSPDFQIAVAGFDTNRDLYIDVKVDSQETEGADGEEA